MPGCELSGVKHANHNAAATGDLALQVLAVVGDPRAFLSNAGQQTMITYMHDDIHGINCL